MTDLITYVFPSYSHVTVGKAEAYLPLDQGLAVISRHAKDLGYDGVILFLDELILWLAGHAANVAFIHQEGQKLAKLVESQEADRPIPIISFIARQKTLQELVGENATGVEKANLNDALKHGSGRIDDITLEDINLPDIVAGRVLRPKDQSAVDLIDEAFENTAKARDDVMSVLLTSQGNREMFRKVYPFSPALVDTLVAASSLLQRNRTAIKALMELLVEQREELTLGNVIPVGDLFDIVAQGDDVFSHGLKELFDNARRLYQDGFRPMLEHEHQISEEQVLNLKGEENADTLARAQRFRNDARLVKTLLMSALVPRVECFQSLTPQRLAALNHGTIKSPFRGGEGTAVLNKLRKWSTQVGQLRVSEGDNPTVTLQLVGVDVERILEHCQHMDNTGNRKKKIRELVLEAAGIEGRDLLNTHTILWRGTERDFTVEFANVREKTTDAFRQTGDGWKLLIDFPFDEQGFGPKDDLNKLEAFLKSGESSRTLVWLPQFLSSKVQSDLGRLIMFEHVLSGDNFKEATRHLTPQSVPQARTLLENQRSALRSRILRDLEMAYGVRPVEKDVLNPALQLEESEQFQSLWAGFTPRAPVAADLRDALEKLLVQALADEYPGHPEFPVDSKISRSQIQSVWEELSKLPEVGGDRLEVDKKLRSRVRSIAQPLKLGQMAETHFVPDRHWIDEFDKKMHLEDLKEPTVADLDRWMDEPRATGLPSELRDLVILSFASRTNRSFKLQGVNYKPEIGKIKRDARLVVQPLPTQEEWARARELAGKVFRVEASALLNADTISRFADDAQQSARAEVESVKALPGVLAEQMNSVGLDPEKSRRMVAAREARKLVDSVLANDKPKGLVESLGGFSLNSSLQELAASVRAASAIVGALRTSRTEVFDLLAGIGGDDAERVLRKLHQSFDDHEFQTPLVSTLRDCTDRAWKIVHANQQNKSPSSSSAASGTHTAVSATTTTTTTTAVESRQTLEQKTLTNLSRDEALEQLEDLKEKLTDGRRVDISWTVWEK